ncbi:MAG: hypothetical protein N3I86_02730 [Verrucomicrobiae bacterium]|nr:hypothetical protein [Verrucomicrobiae bacterium]
MKEKDIVTLVFRLIGLVGMVLVVRHWLRLWHSGASVHFDEPVKLIVEVVLIAIGLYLLRGAPLLIRFAFPQESPPATTPKA